MIIKLNGKKKETVDNLSVLHLLNLYQLNPDYTVVELNQKILNIDDYENVVIKDGDSLELIRFMGGG